MCGISGVTGSGNVVPALYDSIKSLEYRGYDSCGMAVVNKGEVAVRKNVGGVEEVNQKEHLTTMQGSAGIAHTRWATHGLVTQINAHPHSSQDGQFSIVHNGIIQNYQEIREELQSANVSFKSETDTEVLVHLIAQAYEECGDVEKAFLKAAKRLQGSYATVMVSTHEPETIYAIREGAPLVLGVSEGRNYVSSDINAFLQFTRDALVLEDGEYASITPQRVEIRKIVDRSPVVRPLLHVEWDPETSRKGGYAHFMLKEIFEQPQTIRNALNVPSEGIESLADLVNSSKQTFLMGVGTTYYVALAGQYFFSRYLGKFVNVISSDEFTELAVLGEEDLVISISQSGETFDTRRGVDFAKSKGARTASIVNVMGSSLSMQTDQVIMQGSGREICVVSTKAAIAQMIILLRVALEAGQRTGHITAAEHLAAKQELEALPPIVETMLNERSGFIRNQANKTAHYKNWMVLGRGIYYPMALEGALKMKEVTYQHVEGMPAGFLKHGTLSLVDADMLSLFLVPPPEAGDLHTQTLFALEEVKARGGPVVAFMTEGDGQTAQLSSERVELPQAPLLVTPFLHMIAGQLYAYFSALNLGRAIDKPRNLAKSVTVG